jgi:hypothetical protein
MADPSLFQKAGELLSGETESRRIWPFLATPEMDIVRIVVLGQSRQKVCKTPSQL